MVLEMVGLAVQEGKLEIFIMEAIIILLIAFLFFELLSISDKNKEIESLKFDIELLKGRVNSYKAQYYLLRNTVNTMNNYNKVGNNQQIIDAIKYAMKKSHPDNGGNTEDFKKFRDLYNSMKWGNYEKSI